MVRWLFLLGLVASGCAHTTVHEYCVENEYRYRDYDECYAEVSAARVRRDAELSHAGKVMRQASENMTPKNEPSQHGTMYTNCDSYGNCTTRY